MNIMLRIVVIIVCVFPILNIKAQTNQVNPTHLEVADSLYSKTLKDYRHFWVKFYIIKPGTLSGAGLY